MAIDTSGLYGWPDPDGISAAADDLAARGKTLREGIDDCGSAWQGLLPHYSTSDEAVQQDINTFFELVTAHGDLVKGSTSMAKDIMRGFADDIRQLQYPRSAALNRKAEHDRLVSLGEEPEGIYTEAEVQAYINEVVGQLNADAESRAAELEAIDAEAIGSAGCHPHLTPSDGVAVGAMLEFQRVNYTYTVPTRVEVPVYDYTTTAPSGDWIVDPDGNISRAPFVTSREQVGTHYEMREVEHPGVRTERVGLRPPVNEWAYRNLDWYQNRVNEHPDRYAPPGPRIWDLRSRLDDVVDAVQGTDGASAANRALRVAGPVATVVGAGLTYNKEYQTALQELAHENPAMGHDDLESRAQEMAAVQGTTQVVLDLGAGATGAAIGTAIGGPLGTVVGFGVGIGVSWLLEETGAADVMKDAAQDGWDTATDAIGDAWNSVFG
jgi:hypothetical protein